MVVVAILGILAAIAIPAFTGYVRRSKTSEAMTNLNAIFKAAAAHYAKDVSISRTEIATGCVVPASTIFDPDETPDGTKHSFDGTDAPWRLLGFHIADYVYFQYAVFNTVDGNTNPMGVCNGNATNLDDVYTFVAQGDLDGDSEMSTFELAAGVDRDGQLFHARGIYMVNELE